MCAEGTGKVTGGRKTAQRSGDWYSYEVENAYEFFSGFEEWVNQKAELNLYRSWYKVLIFLSTTEESAFDLLFNYLQEYTGNKFKESMSTQKRKIPRYRLSV